eukprot:2108552-Prymnesium_polylepis.1
MAALDPTAHRAWGAAINRFAPTVSPPSSIEAFPLLEPASAQALFHRGWVRCHGYRRCHGT